MPINAIILVALKWRQTSEVRFSTENMFQGDEMPMFIPVFI